MESKEVTALFVLDHSAAFDTVDHDKFLTVLCNHFGITSNALFWFDTYLHPRQFYVNVGGISHQTNHSISQFPRRVVGGLLYSWHTPAHSSILSTRPTGLANWDQIQNQLSVTTQLY